jgi:3-dehydroquinate dehydratase-2
MVGGDAGCNLDATDCFNFMSDPFHYRFIISENFFISWVNAYRPPALPAATGPTGNEMGTSILIINGPNLNLLGTREPEIYGKTRLSDIQDMCERQAKTLGLDITFLQHNHEGDMIDAIQNARPRHGGIIINAAAYTHTSVAIMDALKAVDLPCIEVHLSNIFARETFRHHSYISFAATGIICGFGARGYLLAMDAIADILQQKT